MGFLWVLQFSFHCPKHTSRWIGYTKIALSCKYVWLGVGVGGGGRVVRLWTHCDPDQDKHLLKIKKLFVLPFSISNL